MQILHRKIALLVRIQTFFCYKGNERKAKLFRIFMNLRLKLLIIVLLRWQLNQFSTSSLPSIDSIWEVADTSRYRSLCSNCGNGKRLYLFMNIFQKFPIPQFWKLQIENEVEGLTFHLINYFLSLSKYFDTVQIRCVLLWLNPLWICYPGVGRKFETEITVHTTKLHMFHCQKLIIVYVLYKKKLNFVSFGYFRQWRKFCNIRHKLEHI